MCILISLLRMAGRYMLYRMAAMIGHISMETAELAHCVGVLWRRDRERVGVIDRDRGKVCLVRSE